MAFTLKLYRNVNDQLVTEISEVARVTTMQIGVRKRMI